MRTAWVYSAFGGNFVKTMLRLMAEREELSVVADQVGTPTWARGLADALWLAADQSDLQGLYHWTDAGVCSWYDFAVAIAEEALEIGLLQRMPRIHPIPGSAYPTPAARPAFSVLDKNSTWAVLKTESLHWRSQLRSMLKELKESSFE
jgi:dTDP-4-dehydrorhamnose reductase